MEKERQFKLSEAFVKGFIGKQPEWGPLGYFVYKRCVSVDTPILTRDLKWIPAGDIPVGTEILAFDEETGPGRKGRCIRTAKITHNLAEEAECVEIKLSNGDTLISTPDHSWLTLKADSTCSWRESRNLLHGKTKKCFMLKYFDVWGEDFSYEGGFLAAAFDGEGCLDRHRGLSFTQVKNEMLDKVQGYLDKFGFIYTLSDKKPSTPKGKPCFVIRITGADQVARFLGMFRPPRLLARYIELQDEMQLKRQKFRNKKSDIAVVSVTPIGKRKIAVISTSTKTHFTGGYPSHNTYARELPNGNTEEWWQTCRRVVEGTFEMQRRHISYLSTRWDSARAQKSAQEMYKLMWDFKFLPPGRGLWAQGSDFVMNQGGSAALFNCSFTSTDDIQYDFADPFCFCFSASAHGIGVGFDTEGAGKCTIVDPRISDNVVIIDDSREGWVDALRTVLSAYVGAGVLPKFDYSKIRPFGTKIKRFGGTASGPEALRILLEEAIPSILTPGKITSTQIVDLMNVIGRCVVAGGARRSAELALGGIDDDEFIALKGDKEKLMDYRWASNNSVKVPVGYNNFQKLEEHINNNGEPGIIFIDNCRKFSRMGRAPDNKDIKVMGVNPCSEITLESRELCNICEVFVSRCDTFDEFKRAIKYAYLYSKTITLTKTPWPRTNEIMLRNRRIGLAITGVIENINRLGFSEHISWCERGYDYIQELDKTYSDWLCIPRSIKTTTIKPSGSVSLLPGVTPGIHYPHSEYYIRNVRITRGSPLLKILQKCGYRIEQDKYEKESMVVSFPIHEKYFKRGKNDITIWEQLENTAQMQEHWSDNAISVTVTVRPGEESQIAEALDRYQSRLKTVSFLPLKDHKYEQAPYIEITKDEYEQYVYNLEKLVFDNGTHEVQEKFCDGDVCQL